MGTADLFRAVESGHGDGRRTALATSGGTWTLDDLLTAAGEVATALRRRPDPGEPVVSAVSDPAATAVTSLGADLAGVAVIHADPASPAPPFGQLLRDEKGSEPGGEQLCAGALRLWLSDRRYGLGTVLPPHAQTFLTSGSTGQPVGVVRTPKAVLADAGRIAEFLRYREAPAMVAAAPVFHVYGFAYALIAPLLSGTPVRHLSSRSVPSQLARAVRDTGASLLIGVPAHFGLLAGAPDLADGAWDSRLSGLRRAVSAGAPLADGVAAILAARFGFTLFNCYGSSEAGAVTLTPLTGSEERGEIGEPLPGVELRIAAPDAGAATGELRVRTGSLAVGRLRDGQLEALTGPGGWYATGDLATVLPGGGFRLVGRLANVINVAGEKVHPEEVERVLLTHPAVIEAQVLAEPDAARGQIPVARVVLRDPGEPAELTMWCRDRMPAHHVPRRFDAVPAIPRSATGKPLRPPASAGADP